MNKFALTIATAFLATAIVSAPAFAAGDAAAGKSAFKKKCKTCHVVKDNGKNGLGPNLFGVIGRKAGSIASFKKYTDAMKGSGVVWDDVSITKMMENPSGFMPGSKMKSSKVDDAAKRANILAYLNSLK